GRGTATRGASGHPQPGNRGSREPGEPGMPRGMRASLPGAGGAAPRRGGSGGGMPGGDSTVKQQSSQCSAPRGSRGMSARVRGAQVLPRAAECAKVRLPGPGSPGSGHRQCQGPGAARGVHNAALGHVHVPTGRPGAAEGGLGGCSQPCRQSSWELQDAEEGRRAGGSAAGHAGLPQVLPQPAGAREEGPPPHPAGLTWEGHDSRYQQQWAWPSCGAHSRGG
ncbi:unnamed protein product, partial [Discosporangium mesarthrocarpum]